MIALLKKDWRLNRVPVIGGLVMIAAPYVIVSIAYYHDAENYSRSQAHSLFIGAALCAMWLTAVVAAVFGSEFVVLRPAAAGCDALEPRIWCT